MSCAGMVMVMAMVMVKNMVSSCDYTGDDGDVRMHKQRASPEPRLFFSQESKRRNCTKQTESSRPTATHERLV